MRRARTYSGLDSGVRLDISSDVGTKKRKTDRERRREEGKGKRAVNLDDRLKLNCSNYRSHNQTLLNTAAGCRLRQAEDSIIIDSIFDALCV